MTGLSYTQKIAVDRFAKQAVTDMKIAVRTKKVSNYKRSAVNASGNLDRSIEYRMVHDGVEIWANSYAYYVIYGRKPGNAPPFQVIRDWIDEKGIIPDAGMSDENKDSMAWAVVKSIAKDGTTIFQSYKGVDNGLFSEIVTDEAIQKLTNELFNAVSVDLESMIDKRFSSTAI